MMNPDDEHSLKSLRRADPGIQALDDMVTLMVQSGLLGQTYSVSHIWCFILKPLVVPYLGHGRGHPGNQVNPDMLCVDWREVFEDQDRYCEPATNELEAWLRTSEAFDQLTDLWLERLEAASKEKTHA